ncbi:DNA polymerase III subunit gamma and tau [Bifidobacterium longum]|uniref:DNA-directed DNA polymerase n=1 Tax=Bifidobacterium longum subsp. longum TaxID=1679 RepID=A0A9Q8QXB1_BIFLL|nr:DNA polymerase III subunit gamma and tau [Bifidobacterium longum]UNL64489.1 DNA polymerase III subunit gamma and tau [Bifidobacterium longum subsp. longum]UNL68022.1 DNA polymerase III subunit gamma and tau [Bifidobacterium longum subsp. longum]UNL70203.1 DNA polymerase III subunit gamma and tau [Bifidobacterium longum subsp. longum]UNL71590.1 DNA polymerase III subunit gamma and tau [Bifidobacterium longum subsp. longum]UNL82589.1 DNA polymerase III subunit gamma and tau [Bifidobacterium l
MALALYRRYRPDTFEGVIGQDQVTVPLMRALDEGKLTHAYLFSGPRGCGKTSSARILARCVNCAKGPTSHPCGECESCKDLATGGPGSIDVVEIDAASHNGVNDARELRERAGFAPARDRYKIFILDEAHMVTQQGFNALLKIVEEPPEHVMFIFATTEPDKVIGTIRSRTHHYPFRLVPQEVMGPYLETICDKEGIKPEPGVLKLAMRAGGGSMRDTLSVLDQLMVGSVEGVITHDAAVALLGFTPEALIGEAVDAVINHNGEALYGVIQKVVVGGFDPRRFVEDLLARVRDLLVLTLAGDRAESVLSDTAEAEDMDDLHRQAKALGLGALTAMADIINTTLGAMTGAISPRMRLELLAARLLAGSESGFATAAPAPASSGMPPAAASSTSTTSAASGTGASGFAGASRGGFAGASHGGFSGAARNQQAAAPQSTASHESAVGDNGPVSSPVSDRPAGSPSAQPAAATAAANAWGAPATSPAVPAQPVTSPAASDNRSIDEKWDAAVAALPETIREYVSRDKVPTVKFGPNRKSLPCLSMTFDKSLSQHAFALAVDNSGKKAASVVLDAVRNEFGANAVIAPSAVAANGERVESVKRMSPEQLAKVKQQIAMAKAGLAASSLGAGLGIHMGSEPKAPKPTATGQAEDTDDSHRAGQSSAFTAAKSWSDDDPWAKPAVSNASPQSADGFAPNEPAAAPAPEEHHKKHVAVPDISDGVDPWAAPAAPVAPAASVASAGPTGQSTGQPATAAPATAVAGASDDPWNQPQSQATASLALQPVEADPWNQPYQQSPHDDPWNQPQGNHAQAAPQPGDDPWNQPQSQTPASSVPQTVSGNMSGDDPWNQPQSVPQPAAGDDPWNQPQPAQPTPNADPWNSQPQPQPQVAAEDDEYSMNDQSLGEATTMNLDDLKKLFEVKKVEQFAADDPKNPKNIQPAKKHSDE